MKKNRVCIVEDDVVFRLFCKTLMRDSGFSDHFVEFDNGHKALAWFVLLDPDSLKVPNVVILDINMPQMDGWAFLEAFKNVDDSIKANLKIYLLTSSLAEIDRTRAMEHPLVNGYFSKPFQDWHILQIENDLLVG